MPEERIIPAVQTVAEFVIKVNGTEIPRTIGTLLVHVSKVVNKVSQAKLILEDYDADSAAFPQSNGDLFVPGNSVEILAGDPEEQTAVFSGMIIKQALSIRPHAAPQLTVECRHKAVKITVGRKSAVFHDSTDSDAINQILQEAGFTDVDVEDTPLTHNELVQYNCTDWDFMVARAEQNGLLVLTNNESITLRRPDYMGDAALSLLAGATLIDLDVEMDSRLQFSVVKTEAWDAASQAMAAAESTSTEVTEQGNLPATDLADVLNLSSLELRHGGGIKEDELKAWADAQLLKSRGAKIRGRVKFSGVATLNPGDLLKLDGIGERFSGKALVTGVRHDYDRVHGWKTQAQFGSNPEWFVEEYNVAPPKAGGLLPGAVGLLTGVVTDNEDPEGEMRVRVKIPFINAEDDGVWARMAQVDAGNNRGLFFRPEIGDEVVLGFLYDDPRQPVILGMLNSSALPSPLSPTNENHQKGYTSREGLKLLFDDEKKSITLETPGGNKITLSDETQGIILEDQHGNKIETGSTAIKITGAVAVEITAATDLKLTAANLTLAGNSGLSLSGSGNSTLESSGILELKGSLVKIN